MHTFVNTSTHTDAPSRTLALHSAGILGLQLLVTAAVTAGFMFSAPLRTYVYTAQWPFWLAFGLSIRCGRGWVCV